MLGPAGAPCAPAVPWAHPWAGAQHHGAPRRAHVAAVARCQKVPRFAGRAQRGPQTTPLLLAGGSLRSPPAPPPAAACRPARGVAAGTACAIMQGQAAPMTRRHSRPCIIAQPVPYRGPGRTSPVGQRARCRSRLVAGPTLVGPGRPALCRALAVRPGPDYITGLTRAFGPRRPSRALARAWQGPLQPAISPLSRAANLGALPPAPRSRSAAGARSSLS